MQQNITFRNSPPSASSMRDGQIVFARNSKGIAMYTKQGSQLFHSQFNSSAHVDRSLNKISPNVVQARNLSYTKFTDYRIFQHTFRDDIGTSEVYIPWGGNEENTNARLLVSYLAPFKMTFHKLLLRPDASINADGNYTFKIKIVKNDTANTSEVGSYQLRNKTIGSPEGENYFTIHDYNFLINAPFDSLSVNIGQKVLMSIQSDNDPGNDITWNMTSVWKTEVDLS